MSVSAQAGLVGFGPQPARGQDPLKWYRHRFTQVSLGVDDEVKEGPMEVGGVAVPTFPYKTGPMNVGFITMQPRLIDSFGWLLYSMLGYKQGTVETSTPGIFDSTFALHPTSSTFVPWIGLRKMIPRRDNDPDTDLGEIYKDNKILGGTLILPNEAPITMRMDILGREYINDNEPQDWVWENSMEPWQSIPVACRTEGFIKIGGDTLPVIQGQVTWQNIPLDIKKEKVYGDPFLEDVTIIQRRLGYKFVVKWNNPDLYEAVQNGGTGNLEWSSKPYVTSFDVKTVSSTEIPGSTEPYALEVSADQALLKHTGTIELSGNDAVLLTFEGTALESDTDYALFRLRNQVDAYDWPAPGSGSGS